SADLSRYSRWRLLDGRKGGKEQLELEVLMRGLLEPRTLIDFFRGFVAYGGAGGGASFNIIGPWDQYRGVKGAVERAGEAPTWRATRAGGCWMAGRSARSSLSLKC